MNRSSNQSPTGTVASVAKCSQKTCISCPALALSAAAPAIPRRPVSSWIIENASAASAQ